MAKTAEELCFHPFFDDWAGYRLIVAEIDYSDEAGIDIIFRVSDDESIPALMRSRAESHVRLFNLAVLYEIHSKSELIDRKRFFVETFEEGGATALRVELEREFRSRLVASPNSWQTALYDHLKSNDYFLREGFNRIPDVD